MAILRPVPERRHGAGPRAASADWLAFRRTADVPLDDALHDVAEGLANLDRRLIDIGVALKNATRAR
ncbi:MAG: hypothetical protein RID42_03255 [Alphaproteobacteria bacterium]